MYSRYSIAMKRKRIIKIIFLLGLLISLFLFWRQIAKNKFLEVSFLDVGQGDASLIEFPDGKNILIDGGPDNLILNRLGEELPPYRRKINFIIISHFHDDHVAGLLAALERYKVEKIIFAAGVENFLLGELLLAEAKRQKIELIAVEIEASLELAGGCQIFFINPLSLGVCENENNSLITKLTCADYDFLFSGDNEKEVEDILLTSGYDLSADVFKASHHGSKTSNQEDFLRVINPKLIAVPVGADNRFNHPSPEFLEIASFLQINVIRTDLLGTVSLRINLANIK